MIVERIKRKIAPVLNRISRTKGVAFLLGPVSSPANQHPIIVQQHQERLDRWTGHQSIYHFAVKNREPYRTSVTNGKRCEQVSQEASRSRSPASPARRGVVRPVRAQSSAAGGGAKDPGTLKKPSRRAAVLRYTALHPAAKSRCALKHQVDIPTVLIPARAAAATS